MNLDLATIFGLLIGFVFVAIAIALGGDVAGFINPPSILIVIGGTFAITTVSFTIPEIMRAQGIVARMLVFKLPNASEEAKSMVELAQKARVNGILNIQADIDALNDTYVQQGLMLAIDGVNPEAVATIMEDDTESMMERHERTISILRRSAELAPAMGLIGTLIGLVQMLGNLSDPSAIGPAMAVALLTTLYGAILANMVFTPLASKMEKNSCAEVELRRIYATTVQSVAKQENPRQLEVMLNAILPPAGRVNVFN
ncbi:MAG: flagellar motor protein MotA [Magnetococcales bacterium]|nr:flagellar motor protein MotA [Magnetococcales bacterium]